MNRVSYSRVGNFYLSDVFIQDLEAMSLLVPLLGQVFITSCIHNWGYGRFEYIGCSDLFRIVEEGAEAPSYLICKGEEGKLFFEEINK